MRYVKYTQNFLCIIVIITLSSFFIYSQNNADNTFNNKLIEEKVLSIAFAKTNYTFNFINSLNVFESTLYTALYSGLVTADPRTLQPRVGLAVSWFVNEDNTVYTFNIRRDAKFSDGSSVTARDVKESWLASIRQKTSFIYLFYAIKGVSQYLSGEADISDIKIEALSSQVLQVTLERPTNYFLKTITHGAFSVSSQSQLAKTDWDTDPTNIVFSGPYVVKYADKSSIILVKNKYFWAEDSVQNDGIKIQFYEESQRKSIFDQFLDGEIQWTDAYSESGSEKMKKEFLYNFPLFGTQYLFFRTQEVPWNNANVRRAIRLLLPLEDILKKYYTFPAINLVRTIPGIYTPPLIKIEAQNIEMAKALLEEAGFSVRKKKGKHLPAITIFVPTYLDPITATKKYNPIFDDIKAALMEHISLQIIIKTEDEHKYHAALATEEYTLATNSWIGDFADPMAFLQMWAYKNEVLGSDYDDEDYREFLEQSYIARTPSVRAQSLQKAEKKLLYEGVVIPMRALYAVEFVRSDLIEGWTPNPLNIHSLGAIKFISQEVIPFLTYFKKKTRFVY